MRKFRNQIKNYFYLSEKEANGFIVLSFFMFLVLLFPWGYEYYLIRTYKPSSLVLSEIPETKEIEAKENSTTPSGEMKLSAFNPNTYHHWEELGVPGKIARRIEKYKAKGGRFKIKNDLLKIYGFPEETFYKIHSFILLPDSLISPSVAKPVKPVIPEKNLNTATQEDFANISGIGKVLSGRIVKFRDALGGFYNSDQIFEVYGLDSLVAAKVKKAFYVAKEFSPATIPVNSSAPQQLALHPYISKRSAEILVNYRTQNGIFKTREDLIKSKAFESRELEKLLPYLKFD
jgi:DNA uptake protein ComE-like DNA-binding protein